MKPKYYLKINNRKIEFTKDKLICLLSKKTYYNADIIVEYNNKTKIFSYTEFQDFYQIFEDFRFIFISEEQLKKYFDYE